MEQAEVSILINILSGCFSLIACLISFIAVRQVRRVDRHGVEINGLQLGVQKLDTIMTVLRQQNDLQAIEMKSLNEKFTTFIIDYHKGTKTRTRV